MLPLQVRVNQGPMAVKEYFTFTKALALLEPHHQIVLLYLGHLSGGKSYRSAEMQSVYSTAPADMAFLNPYE